MENKNKDATFGIFDKIYKYLNRETKEERDAKERKEKERERSLLFGTGMNLTGFNTTRTSNDLFSKYRSLESIQNKNMPLYQVNFRSFNHNTLYAKKNVGARQIPRGAA